VDIPQGLATIVDGKETPAPWQFMFATEERDPPPFGVPGGAGVGFIEYRNNSERRRPPTNHSKYRAAAPIRVRRSPTQPPAQNESGRLGFKPLNQRQSSELDAHAREVECGRGTITFWEPASQSAPLASRLAKKGPVPFGFSVGVANLQKAYTLAAQGTHANLPLLSRGARKSFTVSGELTGGLWWSLCSFRLSGKLETVFTASRGRRLKLLSFRRLVTLDPLPRLIQHLRLPTLVGLAYELRNAFCMFKRTVRREKQIMPEPVP